jgi:dipeptidyl aminopeptidase/acylaminoacyl peptidase
LQVARRVGFLAGVPGSGDAESHAAHLLGRVTAADLSPDGRTLAVLTYQNVLLYRRSSRQSWPNAIARRPQVHSLVWLPQAEALAWSPDGQALYASGEHSPAPLLFLNP